MVQSKERSAVLQFFAEGSTRTNCRISSSLFRYRDTRKVRMIDEHIRLKVSPTGTTYCFPCVEEILKRKLLDSDLTRQGDMLVVTKFRGHLQSWKTTEPQRIPPTGGSYPTLGP